MVRIFETFFEDTDHINPVLFEQVIALYKGRANTIKDMAQKSYFFFERPTVFDQNALDKFIDARAITLLDLVANRLRTIAEWNTEIINRELKKIAFEHNVAFPILAQPIRIALSGGTNSPDIAETLRILGRDESLARIIFAIKNLKN